MSTSLEHTETLSLERRVRMHEAREAIINRLSPNLRDGIDLNRFLHAIVSELGRMMEVDRCDVLQWSASGELRIEHEWRAADDVPSSLGTTIPVDVRQMANARVLREPVRIDDTDSANLDARVRVLAASLQTRSLLIVPVALDAAQDETKREPQVLGLVGLHMTRERRHWLDEEVAFLEATAKQIAVGYQYARLYNDKQREAQTKHALLEIANALNARSEFSAVTSLVLERAIALLGADYAALGVVGTSGKSISLADFKAAAHAATEGVRGLIEEHGQSIDITNFPAIHELLAEGRTLTLLDSDLPFAVRFAFNATLAGRAALVAPVHIGDKTFGLLGLVWSTERAGFEQHEISLCEGIADQIGTALERDQLSAEVMRLQSVLNARQTESNIIGQAASVRRAIELAINVADTNTSVLVTGESGTGKELIANLIHYHSNRRDKPYIKLNCGAIPETLLESELFGHEKGAFTDARARRRGRFEEADGGTLFLDEIGEMSLSAQVRLLRVLQDGEFTRVGGNEVLKTDVRVVAASNVDLEAAIEHNRFRRDLYYRLSVFPIELPPLRERPMDIHPLVIHFIEHYKAKTGRFISGITAEALRALAAYNYPGNVRELENAIERAVIIAAGRSIELEDLPESINRSFVDSRQQAHKEQLRRRRESAGEEVINLEVAIPATLDDIEQQIIHATLDYAGGDKTRTAKLLGIGRKTLYRKLSHIDDAPAADDAN